MNQKKGIIFFLHPNDYNETFITNLTIINQIDVFILLKQYFPNTQNINSEKILQNYSSYIKTIDLKWRKINFSFDEIMNLKKQNVELFIVSKEYLPNNILAINNPSNIKLIETQGKQIIAFENDYRYLEFKINNGQRNSSLNSTIKIFIILIQLFKNNFIIYKFYPIPLVYLEDIGKFV